MKNHKLLAGLLALTILLTSSLTSLTHASQHSLKLGSGAIAVLSGENTVPLLDGLTLEYEYSLSNNTTVGLRLGTLSLSGDSGTLLGSVSAEGSLLGAAYRYYLGESFAGLFGGIGFSSRSLKLTSTNANADLSALTLYVEGGYILTLGPLGTGVVLQAGTTSGTLSTSGTATELGVFEKIGGNYSGIHYGIRSFVSYQF